MTTKQLAARLARLEAQRQPLVQVVICWCGPDEKHRPDCEAAGDDDGLIITWPDDIADD